MKCPAFINLLSMIHVQANLLPIFLTQYKKTLLNLARYIENPAKRV